MLCAILICRTAAFTILDCDIKKCLPILQDSFLLVMMPDASEFFRFWPPHLGSYFDFESSLTPGSRFATLLDNDWIWFKRRVTG